MPEMAADEWLAAWHRGEIAAAPAEGQTAAEWQAELFDQLVRHDPVGAFGRGPVQEVLWAKRVDLALRAVDPKLLSVDVGCGNGHVARAVASGSGGRVVGIDTSAECVRAAAEQNPHPSVEYRHVTVEDFEPGEPLGLITMYEVLEHVDDPRAVLRRLASWLAPGGHLIFSTPNRSSFNRVIKNLPGLRGLYSRFSKLPPEAATPGHVEEYHYAELRDMVTGAGLEVERALGAVLLMPFPDAIGPLARSHRFARLNVRSGDWWPKRAGDVYLVARKPA